MWGYGTVSGNYTYLGKISTIPQSILDLPWYQCCFQRKEKQPYKWVEHVEGQERHWSCNDAHLPPEVKPGYWIAKDKDGEVWWFTEHPCRGVSSWQPRQYNTSSGEWEMTPEPIEYYASIFPSDLDWTKCIIQVPNL